MISSRAPSVARCARACRPRQPGVSTCASYTLARVTGYGRRDAKIPSESSTLRAFQARRVLLDGLQVGTLRAGTELMSQHRLFSSLPGFLALLLASTGCAFADDEAGDSDGAEAGAEALSSGWSRKLVTASECTAMGGGKASYYRVTSASKRDCASGRKCSLVVPSYTDPSKPPQRVGDVACIR